jgi:hypothetical protein
MVRGVLGKGHGVPGSIAGGGDRERSEPPLLQVLAHAGELPAFIAQHAREHRTQRLGIE